MIRSLIVDDEPRAVKGLQILVEKYCPEINLIGSAHNIEDAYKVIIQERPELVFLDINMPHGTGIDLLERIKNSESTKVIFITAYDEFAIKALRLSAIDYLLKPVDKEELIGAVERFKSLSRSDRQLSVLTEFFEKKKSNRFSINTMDGIHILENEDVFYISSEKNYSKFHLLESFILASKPLGDYEKILDPNQFIRIHRSYLVNLDKVCEFDKKQGGVVLKDGTFLEVSRSKKDFLLEKLQSL